MSRCTDTCTPETCDHYCVISICDDCLFFLANGDIPEERPELPGEISANWSGFWLALGCDPECCGRDDDGGTEDWFSWTSCDACGSHLGGNRRHATPFKI